MKIIISWFELKFHLSNFDSASYITMLGLRQDLQMNDKQMHLLKYKFDDGN